MEHSPEDPRTELAENSAESLESQDEVVSEQPNLIPPPTALDDPSVTRAPVYRNVVFFGETGVGKSAIINMLREGAEEEYEVATVSNAAIGCTLTSTQYPLRLGPDVYNLWDTAGLVEGGFGSVTAAMAEANLVRLLETIPGGVNLLVYCVRGRRYRNIIKDNYVLFYEKTCRRGVPIVLVITGLENETVMEDWWMQNHADMERRGIYFDGHACITSARGKESKMGGYMFEAEYEESLETIRSVVVSNSLNVGFQVAISNDVSDAPRGKGRFTRMKHRVSSMIPKLSLDQPSIGYMPGTFGEDSRDYQGVDR